MPDARDIDVLIVGAGISGIAAGYYVQRNLPRARYRILEARGAIGGTWDLFRYPGVRSDSDMHTMGFSFRPWHGDVALADGASIAAYIRDVAREFGIDDHIRFRHRVVRATWSTARARWSVDVVKGDAEEPETLECRFLYMCSGYYDYGSGYLPEFPHVERYRGTLVHPQNWPEQLDYRGKRVLVIGSGATAVTIVPAMAEEAQHVTMLQRSPTYIVPLPKRDRIARRLNRLLPPRLAHPLIRWKNVLLQMYFYNLMRRRPDATRVRIKAITRRALGAAYDEQHFTPPYAPWDQRMCFIPDGDLFRALRSGKASIVTGRIAEFTETGVRLESGERLDADIVITATGLNMRLLSGVELFVDGAQIDLGSSVNYKGMTLCGVPNFAFALGYTNASWTLKCELTARYVCRLLAYLDRRGYAYCVAQPPGPAIGTEPAIGLTSGYVKRAEAHLPRQGKRVPWRLHQNYALDLAALRFGRIADGVMEFVRR